MLAIAAVLISKMFFAGIVLGILFLGGAALSATRKITYYLWYAEETAAKRVRAIAVSLMVLIVLPTALAFLPLPSRVRAAAVVAAEHEATVRAKTPGFLEQVTAHNGQYVSAGEPLAQLGNDNYIEQVAQAEADLLASRIRHDAFRVREPARALQEQAQSSVLEHALFEARRRISDLQVPAPIGGRVVGCVRDSDIGSFLPEGSQMASIVAGRNQIRAILSENDITRAQPRAGDRVVFRAAANPSRTTEGIIARIAPTGSRTVSHVPLTHIGGGDIAVDPQTHDATLPYFELIIELPAEESRNLHLGMTGSVCLGAGAEPIAIRLGRRFVRFWNRLLQG